MLIDKQNEFSDSQVLTATAVSTNVINTQPGASFTNVLQNLGGPGAVYLVVQVDVALAGGTSLVVSLESDSTANLATSPTVHFNSGTILTAALTAGATLIAIPLPQGNYEKYMGVRYTIVGPYTSGSISAFLSKDVQAWKPYAVGQASNL